VIILTGGRDYSHGGWMWNGMKELRQRADRAFMGTLLAFPILSVSRVSGKIREVKPASGVPQSGPVALCDQ